MDFLRLDEVCMLTVEFFLFACAGWVMEVTLKYIQYHRFINRGFLIGPYCPIYGWGVVAVTILVGGLMSRRGTLGETFLVGMFICGALEYFTSWYMEKLFHARWWDYSQKPMNLNGRIWIGNLLLFGLASVVIVHWIDPILFAWMGRWPPILLKVAALSVVGIMLADHAASHFLMNLVRKEIDAQDGDNTEEISRKVHELLQNRAVLVRRIHEAYPELQARPKAMVQQLREAKNSYRQAVKFTKRELQTMAREMRQEKAQALEEHWEPRIRRAVALQRDAKEKLRAVQHRIISHREKEQELEDRYLH